MRVNYATTDAHGRALVSTSYQTNYLSTEHDRQTMIAAIKTARQIADSPVMQPYIKREHQPGINCTGDADLLEFCRDKGQTIFHPVGTAKMGNDPMAVVDDRLRVRGLSGLRVVDCSIIPTIVSGNTHAPAVMIGEKAADMIIEEIRSELAI